MLANQTNGSKRPRLPFRLTVNGRDVETSIEPRETLLDFLRDRLGLKGAKRSCDVQVCGTCTVLLDGQPVSSCCTLAYEARERQVITIEGLSQAGELHPIQAAFIRCTGLQCGFCTPGMILTAKSLLDQVPNPTPEQIRNHMEGNLCRCTGYWNILEAVEVAARTMVGQNNGTKGGPSL
ncbi:MAG: (2Fe-2S)-binding protein [Anaerolineae bacterium]|nr:(2Fe-2S)-binding protein [Anaerolineae bacterium]